MLRRLMFFFAAVFLLLECSVRGQPGKPLWSAPELEHTISIRNGETDERLTFDTLIAELSSTDAVFLGESHTDETTHRVQLAVYRGLLESRQQKVVLSMEMFERDVQDTLDQYLSGEIDEPTFLASVRPWSNYQEAYRPMIEHAKEIGTPVIAANFPLSLRRRMAMEGNEVLQSLPDEEKAWLPLKFYPNTPDYWKRTDNATRGHQGFMMPGDSDDQRLYSTQSLWDNAMGDACAQALDQNPGFSVLHLNGNFHTSYWDGTVHQLKQRKPSATVKTISLVPTLNPATAVTKGKPAADYVVYVESRATNVNRGERSVQVGRELKYLFHLPAAASADAIVPLLVCLTDDGLTAREGMSRCKAIYGEETAIAVIEAPYRAVGPDMAVGGRWYWPEMFAEDAMMLVEGTERIWAYLMRHYPIDPERVCLVGEGTGGTLAAVLAMHSDRMRHSAIAVQPSRYSKVKDLPLPMPEYYGDDPPAEKRLTVVGGESLRDWWQKELEQYAGAEVPSQFELANADPWESDRQVRNLVRKSLGLPEIPPKIVSNRQYLLIENPTPRATFWGSLQANQIAKSSGQPTVAIATHPDNEDAKQIATKISVESVKRDNVLPLCPGPFGGTTVLVLPDGLDSKQVDTWVALEAEDPLNAKSRFHRIRIAHGTGERGLPAVLEKLKSENRKNILLVPTVFYADFAWLRNIQQSAEPFEDSMTLHWLPGLGGRPGILDTTTE